MTTVSERIVEFGKSLDEKSTYPYVAGLMTAAIGNVKRVDIDSINHAPGSMDEEFQSALDTLYATQELCEQLISENCYGQTETPSKPTK